jgi:hypothetical protein
LHLAAKLCTIDRLHHADREVWTKEEYAPVNKTRKVALRKHRAKARKDEAKRKALRMTAHVAARSAAGPAPRPARPASPAESGS